jgi:outer membrane lipoprotein-sorting protein
MRFRNVAVILLVLVQTAVCAHAAARGFDALPPDAFPDDRKPFAAPGLPVTGSRVSVGLQDVINTVEDAFRPDRQGLLPVSDVSADFFQGTVLASGREMRADGQMFVRFPDGGAPLMYRFDYFRPTRHEIVCDGRTQWTYLPENRQVILSDVSFAFNPSGFDQSRDRATNFLQGLGSISRDFQIIFSSQQYDQQGNYILELLPRRATVGIQMLFMVVHRDSVLMHKQGIAAALATQELLFPIRSTTVMDHQGNRTTLEFSNIKTNSRLQPSLFNFVVPADIQVVKPARGH